MVDYAMGSALWQERSGDERIATISISINYVQTAREGPSSAAPASTGGTTGSPCFAPRSSTKTGG